MSVLGNLRLMGIVLHDQKAQRRCVVGTSTNEIKMSRRNIFEKLNIFFLSNFGFLNFIHHVHGEDGEEKSREKCSNNK